MIKAKAAGGEKFNRSRMAITMGVSSRAAPSLAKKAAMTAPSTTIMGNSKCPLPLPQRATCSAAQAKKPARSEEHTSELQSRSHLVCRLLLEKKKRSRHTPTPTAETPPTRPAADRREPT